MVQVLTSILFFPVQLEGEAHSWVRLLPIRVLKCDCSYHVGLKQVGHVNNNHFWLLLFPNC